MIVKFIAIDVFMTYTCSCDYEIMQLPNTGGTLSVLSNVTKQLGDYKYATGVSNGVSWVGIDQD